MTSCMQGAYLWNWKDKIDRAWIAKYGENLPVMEEEAFPESEVAAGQAGVVIAVSGLGAAALPWLMGVISTRVGTLKEALLIAFFAALCLLFMAFLQPSTSV